ncbi:beta-lactamase hydrolase domain-containing protein [Pantanalinema sp. GBBB05]|uniref:beta-lactamase hydrolase domain-containing protein n=1 Tax=Pantanalinema sp. GBBB05 TaxID=2604139 RepID=UPI001D27E2FA|nr:hypothetical protein [Pantanalinema sp. GBBB05]
MEPIRKITDELSIAGQITVDQLPQLAQEGFRSVLNLRSPEEIGFLLNEQQKVELAGLYYVNFPFKPEAVDDETATHILQQINTLPKPTLVHCDNAVRSAAIALMHIATRQGVSLEKAFKQAKQLGLFEVLTQSDNYSSTAASYGA